MYCAATFFLLVAAEKNFVGPQNPSGFEFWGEISLETLSDGGDLRLQRHGLFGIYSKRVTKKKTVVR